MKQLLLIDDDQVLSELLCEYLREEGFAITPAFDGEQGLAHTQQSAFDLIILDIMMPKLNGLEVLKQLRQQSNLTPVLMLTAKGDDLDRILGLELGADDYLAKPCNPRELLARINAILRRAQGQSTSIQHSQLQLNPARRETFFANTQVILTGTEFKVLSSLYQHMGEIVSKEILCEFALGRTLTRYDRSIDVHVSNVRKKLVDAGADPDIIFNQRGTGYLLKAD